MLLSVFGLPIGIVVVEFIGVCVDDEFIGALVVGAVGAVVVARSVGRPALSAAVGALAGAIVLVCATAMPMAPTTASAAAVETRYFDAFMFRLLEIGKRAGPRDLLG
jgi:hypothetical protein